MKHCISLTLPIAINMVLPSASNDFIFSLCFCSLARALFGSEVGFLASATLNSKDRSKIIFSFIMILNQTLAVKLL